MNILEDFYNIKKFVMITAGVMFVNVNSFMITSASNLKFVTAEHIPSQTSYQLSEILNKVIKLYVKGGFIIRAILVSM